MIAEKLKVDFIPQQNKWSCGAASLVMVYNYFEISRNQDILWQKYQSKGSDNVVFTATDDLVQDANQNKLSTIYGRMPLNEPYKVKANILEIIKTKCPIITCIQSIGNKLEGHFVVIININESNIIYHDPLEGKNRKIKLKKFINRWEETGQYVTGGVFIVFSTKSDLCNVLRKELIDITPLEIIKTN